MTKFVQCEVTTLAGPRCTLMATPKGEAPSVCRNHKRSLRMGKTIAARGREWSAADVRAAASNEAPKP